MCDYSLHYIKSRPAKVGDKLTTPTLAPVDWTLAGRRPNSAGFHRHNDWKQRWPTRGISASVRRQCMPDSAPIP